MSTPASEIKTYPCHICETERPLNEMFMIPAPVSEIRPEGFCCQCMDSLACVQAQGG